MTLGVSTPSPLWFATRALGTVCLILLTLVVVLGIVTAVRWERPLWPRFLTSGLHRNLSLLVVLLIPLHVLTSVLDPFAHLGWRDALVPYGSAYRPVWLGLGVVATDILVALIVTSLLRPWIGHGVWRLVHWLAYASWPVAVLHGLGTGSDARAWWSVGITGACLATVALAIAWRLDLAELSPGVRRGVGLAVPAGCLWLCVWAVRGPMAPGWAQASGTPSGLGSGSTAVSAAPPADGAINHLVTGRVAPAPGQPGRLVLQDTSDRSLVLLVSPATTVTGPLLVVFRSGAQLCATPVVITGNTVDGQCGTVRVTVYMSGDTSHVSGQLVTTGPLR